MDSSNCSKCAAAYRNETWVRIFRVTVMVGVRITNRASKFFNVELSPRTPCEVYMVQFRLSDVTLIGLTSVNLLLTNCLYLLLHIFFYLFSFLGGKYQCLLGPSLLSSWPVVCFCLCYFVFWFAANKCDLSWFDVAVVRGNVPPGGGG